MFNLIMTKITLKIILTVLILIVSGCSSKMIDKYSEKLDRIISAPTNYNSSDLFDTWGYDGPEIIKNISFLSTPESHSLRLTNTKAPYTIFRKTRTNILVTPYLTWQWKLNQGNWTQHPIKIIVGIQSSLEEKNSSILSFISQSGLPQHDRQILISWNKSQFFNKTLHRINPEETEPDQFLFAIRSGPQIKTEWTKEAIDISELYKRAWPTSKSNQTNVVFIGIRADKSQQRATGQIQSLTLSQ